VYVYVCKIVDIITTVISEGLLLFVVPIYKCMQFIYMDMQSPCMDVHFTPKCACMYTYIHHVCPAYVYIHSFERCVRERLHT
jgi:hypothetical protein